jgi:drug/metabolite transporter (DMT)-like permease
VVGAARAQGAWRLAAAAVLFGGVNAVVKGLSDSLPSGVIVFGRNFFGLLALLPFLFRGGWPGLRTRRPIAHAVRSLSGLATMALSFYAYGRMPLADAVALSYTSPLFMPFMAKLWLGERWPSHAGPVLSLGFGGVLLLLKPGAAVFEPVALLALLAGFLAAVAQVGIRDLSGTEPPERTVFYFALIASAASSPALAAAPRAPDAAEWLALAGLGALATAAQMFLTRGYRDAAPGSAGGLLYLAVPVSAALDWALWGQVPDLWSMLGAMLIIVSGAIIVRAERRSHGAP